MKIKLSILFFLLCSVAYAQVVKDYNIIDTAKLKCYYDYDFQQDSANIKSARHEDMLLLIGKKQKSNFIAYSRFYFDSISIARNKYLSNDEMISMLHRLGAGNALSRFSVIKDVSNKKTKLLIGFPGSNFSIEGKLNPMKWKLENKESIIAGYKCKKATCHFAGRDYVAWYTMEIPISEGPYKFGGLPGLIVKVEDTNREHRFTLNGVETIEKTNFDNPVCYYKKKYITAKIQDFLKAFSVHNNGGVASLEQGGVTIQNPNESKIRRRMRARNNFIEK